MPQLFVVPTPIGNLEDMTYRAVRTLQEVIAIFAEDTRHTRKLMTRYSVTTPLSSYHQHNKRTRIPAILKTLERGDVALVSSAGMPSISDPGFELIRAALDAGIDVDVLPGPTAVTTAIVGAAIPAPGFLFVGFLSRRSGERDRALHNLARMPYALVFYEAPHRLIATLSALQAAFGDRQAVAARELSKVHQEYIRGTTSDLHAHFEDHPPRGEFTLVLAGWTDDRGSGPEGDVRTDLARRREAGQDAHTAVADVAAIFGMPRNEVYRLWLSQGNM